MRLLVAVLAAVLACVSLASPASASFPGTILPISKGGTGAATLLAADIATLSTANTFNAPAVASTAETPATFKISESSSTLIVANNSASDAVFDPQLRGTSVSSNRVALTLLAQATADASATVMALNSRIGASTSVATRDVLQVQNNGTSVTKVTGAGVLSVTGGSAPGISTTGGLTIGSGAVTITAGTGTPEAAVTAPIGSLFLRTNGGAATTLYVKESGAGNTGWVAK